MPERMETCSRTVKKTRLGCGVEELKKFTDKD